MRNLFVFFINLFKKIKKSREDMEFKRAVAVIDRHKPGKFNQYVFDIATSVASKIVMKELDKLRILHCHECSDRNQLRVKNGVYLCQSHFNLKQKEDIKL